MCDRSPVPSCRKPRIHENAKSTSDRQQYRFTLKSFGQTIPCSSLLQPCGAQRVPDVPSAAYSREAISVQPRLLLVYGSRPLLISSVGLSYSDLRSLLRLFFTLAFKFKQLCLFTSSTFGRALSRRFFRGRYFVFCLFDDRFVNRCTWTPVSSYDEMLWHRSARHLPSSHEALKTQQIRQPSFGVCVNKR